MKEWGEFNVYFIAFIIFLISSLLLSQIFLSIQVEFEAQIRKKPFVKSVFIDDWNLKGNSFWKRIILKVCNIYIVNAKMIKMMFSSFLHFNMTLITSIWCIFVNVFQSNFSSNYTVNEKFSYLRRNYLPQSAVNFTLSLST